MFGRPVTEALRPRFGGGGVNKTGCEMEPAQRDDTVKDDLTDEMQWNEVINEMTCWKFPLNQCLSMFAA